MDVEITLGIVGSGQCGLGIAKRKAIHLFGMVSLSALMVSCSSTRVENVAPACVKSEETRGLVLKRSEQILEEAGELNGFSPSLYVSKTIWIDRFIVVEWWPSDVSTSAWELLFDCSGSFVRLRELAPDRFESYEDPS